jgi:hypothetical protein
VIYMKYINVSDMFTLRNSYNNVLTKSVQLENGKIYNGYEQEDRFVIRFGDNYATPIMEYFVDVTPLDMMKVIKYGL